MHVSNKAMDFTKILVLLSTHHHGNEDVKKGIWYLKKDKQTFFVDIYSQMVLLKLTTDASFSFLYLGVGQ